MMNFDLAEKRFKELKAQFKEGVITETEFKARLEDLMFQDEQDDWWMIGYESERWHRHDGTNWVPTGPPGKFSEKIALLEPPAPEVIDETITTNTDNLHPQKKSIKVSQRGYVALLVGISIMVIAIAIFIVPSGFWLKDNNTDGTLAKQSTSVVPARVIIPTKTFRPTVMPTSTPRPTATQNIAATEEYEAFFSIVQDFKQEGHISTLDGEYILLDNYSKNMAYMDHYETPTLANNRTVKDFIFNAHFHWSTAIQNPSEAGCGVVFGIRNNYEGFQIFLDKSRVWLQDENGPIGKTRGTGRVSFGNPADAIFTVGVNDHHVFVYVNGGFVGEYTLSQSANTEGRIGYTLLSGTNKDYGTLCEITDAKLWVIDN